MDERILISVYLIEASTLILLTNIPNTKAPDSTAQKSSPAIRATLLSNAKRPVGIIIVQLQVTSGQGAKLQKQVYDNRRGRCISKFIQGPVCLRA